MGVKKVVFKCKEKHVLCSVCSKKCPFKGVFIFHAKIVSEPIQFGDVITITVKKAVK